MSKLCGGQSRTSIEGATERMLDRQQTEGTQTRLSRKYRGINEKKRGKHEGRKVTSRY